MSDKPADGPLYDFRRSLGIVLKGEPSPDIEDRVTHNDYLPQLRGSPGAAIAASNVRMRPLDSDGQPVGDWRDLGTADISVESTEPRADLQPLLTGGTVTVPFELDEPHWRALAALFGIWPAGWVKAARRGRRIPANAAYWQRKYSSVR